MTQTKADIPAAKAHDLLDESFQAQAKAWFQQQADERALMEALAAETHRYLRTIDQWFGPDPDREMPPVCGAEDLQKMLTAYKERHDGG